MTTDREPPTLEARRRTIRRRAFANLILAVRDEASRSNGRFEVEALDDALCLRVHDVRTIVCTNSGYAEAVRDFTVIVVAPPLWPFDREAALVPIVAAPVDFRAPNSDSHGFFCLDTRGVTPERLAGLVYDNIRIKRRRLDHAVDNVAAAFVRRHLPDRPADPRPLAGPPR